MHMGITVHVIPVCIRGSRCNGFVRSPYAYGDPMDNNPRMHMGICAFLYALEIFPVTHRMHMGNVSIWEIKSCIPIYA